MLLIKRPKHKILQLKIVKRIDLYIYISNGLVKSFFIIATTIIISYYLSHQFLVTNIYTYLYEIEIIQFI